MSKTVLVGGRDMSTADDPSYVFAIRAAPIIEFLCDSIRGSPEDADGDYAAYNSVRANSRVQHLLDSGAPSIYVIKLRRDALASCGFDVVDNSGGSYSIRKPGSVGLPRGSAIVITRVQGLR